MNKIEVDVTNLIESVKKENRLFYPVMMHILLKTIAHEESFIFYQNCDGRFLKTLWHPSFEIFYKNYIFDLYQEKKETKVLKKAIVFALYEDQKQKADFILLPFITDNNKTFLPIVVQTKTPKDFEENLKKTCLSCDF